ncbi:MAG: hypothetical protein ACK4N5_07030, partial [Myxococcales bacterium]
MHRPLAALALTVTLLCSCSEPEPLPLPSPVPPPTQLAVRIPASLCTGVPHAFASAARFAVVDVDGLQIARDAVRLEFGGEAVVHALVDPKPSALVTVRILDGQEQLLAVGHARTGISASGISSILVQVFGLERSTLLGDAANRCAALSSARAGHRATLMNDGRIFFTGGLEPGSGGPTTHTYVDAVDALTPEAWTVSRGQPARAFGAERRAFHGAARLKDGRLLIFGGERNVGGVMEVTPSSLVYDPQKDE